MTGKLTDAKLHGLKGPEKGQIEHSDSDVPGLRIRIGVTGAKTFILRKRVANHIRNITLGRYGPRFGLADARRKARSLLSDLETGKPVTPGESLRTEFWQSGGSLLFRTYAGDRMVLDAGEAVIA